VTTFQTSFIPKTSLAKSSNESKARHHITSLASLTSAVVFFAAIAVSIGLFLYQQFLTRNLETMKVSLERARSAFEPALITELKRVDSKLQAAKTLLDAHGGPSPVFSLLEELTLKNLRFINFDYKFEEGGPIRISMRGEALNFSTIALQADVFGENVDIEEALFSNLNANEQDRVAFDFSASIRPRVVLYNPEAYLDSGRDLSEVSGVTRIFKTNTETGQYSPALH
jgi:hypothetical protein